MSAHCRCPTCRPPASKPRTDPHHFGDDTSFDGAVQDPPSSRPVRCFRFWCVIEEHRLRCNLTAKQARRGYNPATTGGHRGNGREWHEASSAGHEPSVARVQLRRSDGWLAQGAGRRRPAPAGASPGSTVSKPASPEGAALQSLQLRSRLRNARPRENKHRPAGARRLTATNPQGSRPGLTTRRPVGAGMSRCRLRHDSQTERQADLSRQRRRVRDNDHCATFRSSRRPSQSASKSARV